MLLQKCARHQQVIIASACPPAQLPPMNTRLRLRVKSGLFADIQLPSKELKRRYVKRFLQQHPFALTDWAQIWLVSRLKTVPCLDGALQKAHLDYQLNRHPINAVWIRQWIRDYGKTAKGVMKHED